MKRESRRVRRRLLSWLIRKLRSAADGEQETPRSRLGSPKDAKPSGARGEYYFAWFLKTYCPAQIKMLKNEHPVFLSPIQMGTAIRAFMAERCPACEGQKVRRIDPFCAECYGRLPQPLQSSISDRSLFIETYQPAIEHLKAKSTK